MNLLLPENDGVMNSEDRSLRQERRISKENLSSPETCNNGVSSTTSRREMTSVRTSCYCKHEGNAARRKDNDVIIHNGNRQSATVASKKSIASNRICGNGRESCKRARHVTNGETPNTNRSTEAQPSNLVLSPETSIALENAEKIVNDAKIQLMEVCAMSSFDSARRNRTVSDEPPLDDEMEERLYVRELVASKFHDACSSRLSEANGKASSRSEKPDSPHVTVRRIDLSGPKFRVSRRRCVDWSSLGYGSDDRSRGRASPARVPSKDSLGVANETTARDDRARDRRRTLSARGNTCGIQIGPAVHIIERQLAKQDLEDVHISPGSSRAQSRANTATYTLRHDAVRNVNDPEGTSKTRRVRLDTLRREKPIGRLIIEAVPTNPASERDPEEVRNSDFGQDDGRIGSPKSRIYRREKKEENLEPQDTEGISECLKNTTSRGTTKFAVIETSGTDMKTWNENLKNKAGNENREEIACGSEEISYAEDDGKFRKRSSTGCLRNDENIADKIQAEENQGDRSKPSLGGDTSRKTAFPRHENIASLCREAESPISYRTIDGHFSHTFNNHNEQDGLCSVAEDERRRSFVSDRAEDNLDEFDLYRPHLDDLDSILHSNDRKLERVVRTTRNLSELLSKLDEDKPRDANREKLGSLDSSADKYSFAPDEPARSSILETELKNEDLAEVRRIEEEVPKGTNAAGTRSSAFARESNDSRSKNSVESSVFPASDASDDPRTSRDGDKAQRSARLSESSMDDGSDVTTFSNLVPALSSTHTEPQTCRLRQEEIARSDRHARSRVTSANKLSKRAIRHSGKEYSDDGTFARLSRKDAFRATDRFVTYILQDEERSIEGKIACALKESAITPATVQKLLDHLREAESIRDVRQTETLDILRSILINVKGQSDRGSANGKETSSRNVPDSSARTRPPPIVVDGSREDGTQQMRAKIEWVAKNLYEPKGHSDFSECHETRESARSTARCESTQCSEMNDSKIDTGQVESMDVAPIDGKNQMDESENHPEKEKTDIPRDIAGSSTRTNATEGTILQTRARNNTSDTGLIADKPEDSRNPDKYFSVSPAFPETRESVRSAARFEFARGSKNKSRDNSKGNSCSETESLKQISDIRSDDDENLGGNSERLSAKIASAREVEVTAIVASETKGVNNEKKLEEDKSNDARANNQDANKIITQADRMIDAQSGVPEEAVEEIRGEKTRDIATSAEKKVLFALSDISEIKNERVRLNASPVRTKLIDEAPAKTDVDFVYSSTKEDIGSLRETENDSQHIAIEGKIEPADNCSAEPRDCIVKSSELVLASRNKEVFLDIAGEDNLKDVRNEEIHKSMTAVENRRDGNETSGVEKSDNESIDLTYRPRNYKINVLSSSNSSVSSTLLDHDDRSTNGMSSANARIGTTPETSHSEGELYMPSSCSYSLGEVRVLRKKNLIEDNAMDRDSSVTVLLTRSMLTSLNDSTVSLLESSGRV